MKIQRLFFVVLFLSQITVVFAQPATRLKLSLTEAKSLTELMCHQLPNIGTIVERLRIEAPGTLSAAPEDEPTVTDDVYDALLQLGPYSLNCLTDKLLDSRWMPDPRTEPLLGGARSRRCCLHDSCRQGRPRSAPPTSSQAAERT